MPEKGKACLTFLVSPLGSSNIHILPKRLIHALKHAALSVRQTRIQRNTTVPGSLEYVSQYRLPAIISPQTVNHGLAVSAEFDAFEFKQTPFHFQASCIAAQKTIRSDRPVARD